MAASELQTGLTDLSEHGAVLECGECARAVVVPRQIIREYGDKAGLRHVEAGYHRYERPDGRAWNEAIIKQEELAR